MRPAPRAIGASGLHTQIGHQHLQKDSQGNDVQDEISNLFLHIRLEESHGLHRIALSKLRNFNEAIRILLE